MREIAATCARCLPALPPNEPSRHPPPERTPRSRHDRARRVIARASSPLALRYATAGHGVEVVGMFFFDDNTYVLRAGDPLGERLAKVAAETGMLLMLCDQCAHERGLAEPDDFQSSTYRPVGTVPGVQVGCFPDLYAALATNPPDQVITL
jgi:sulfur relay (sulfurtransferase) complex TusBCD TusD component (DsrE family)